MTAPAIQVCTRSDHPDRRHGHYGPGGQHWCRDFGSPLLSEGNGGGVRGGYILIFEKPATS